MGLCAEKTAAENGITREANDAYCVESYERVLKAQQTAEFKNDIVAVDVGGGVLVIILRLF